MNRHRLRLASTLTVGVCFTLFARLPLVNATVILVNADAIGKNCETSWEGAFPQVQNGLAASEHGDQICVAVATYRTAAPAGDRAATFQLLSAVRFCSFAGIETELVQAGSDFNVTIRRGHLNGDDRESSGNKDE